MTGAVFSLSRYFDAAGFTSLRRMRVDEAVLSNGRYGDVDVGILVIFCRIYRT